MYRHDAPDEIRAEARESSDSFEFHTVCPSERCGRSRRCRGAWQAAGKEPGWIILPCWALARDAFFGPAERFAELKARLEALAKRAADAAAEAEPGRTDRSARRDRRRPGRNARAAHAGASANGRSR